MSGEFGFRYHLTKKTGQRPHIASIDSLALRTGLISAICGNSLLCVILPTFSLTPQLETTPSTYCLKKKHH